MPLSLLLDEQISYQVADQIRIRRPDIAIVSIHTWRGGAFLGKADAGLLRAAAGESLTLITYDRKTIPPILTEWGVSGEEHSGIVFVDERTIAQADIGGQIRALIQQWDETQDWEWRNVIGFLRAAP